ncbi:caspase family protein [Streptomyces sp. NPDC057412]|uniref:caspase, EACC1-associated type n=1 Tax=Streptomyces sp. NPDC057412 TaxID=3346123 RepID=UPI0036A34089
MTDTRHALIIANERYDDRALKQLKAPGHDADALAEVLGDPLIGDFDVDVVSNQPSYVLRRRIEHFFSDRRRDDTLVVHFSCHGIKSESGELYFAASDTEPLLLEATAVPAQFVRRCMSRSRAGRTVLFLDCCYGGAFSRSSSGVRATGDVNVLDSFTTDKPAGGRGWAVITASSSMEYAVEGGDLTEDTAPRPSVFTGAVVRGLGTGEADLDADGWVSLDELYDYVYDRVRGQNPHQTPSKTAELHGELHLAHSPRGRRVEIVAEPIPESWRAALRSRNHFTRMGAVAELRYRLASESLPVAEGARQALLDVADNDMRQIADTARAHLRETRLQPSTSRLDFGRLRGDAPVPHRTVTLGGLPLARACVPRPTEPWLRVTEVTDGLDVTLDPAAEGRLSADILLKGVADETVIHVEAEREPRSRSAARSRETPPRPAFAPPPGTVDALRQEHARPDGVPDPERARQHPDAEAHATSAGLDLAGVDSAGADSAGADSRERSADETRLAPPPETAPQHPTEPPPRSTDETQLAAAPDAPPQPPEGTRPTPSTGTDRRDAATRVVQGGSQPVRARRADATPGAGAAKADRAPGEGARADRAPGEGAQADRAPGEGARAHGAPGEGAARARWAPGVACAALVAAVASVATFVAAVVAGVPAVRDFVDAGTGDSRSLGSFVDGTGTVPLLVASVVTAAVALVLGAVARHEVRARPERYTRGSTGSTAALTALARYMAIPALFLAVVAFIAWLATRGLT